MTSNAIIVNKVVKRFGKPKPNFPWHKLFRKQDSRGEKEKTCLLYTSDAADE